MPSSAPAAERRYSVPTLAGVSVVVDLHEESGASEASDCAKKNDTGWDDCHTPPTAVLLGWVGARIENLHKHAALYKALGYSVIRAVAPVRTVFAVRRTKMRMFTLAVMRVVHADKRLNRGGVVWHFFSNGGAYCAAHMASLFERAEKRGREGEGGGPENGEESTMKEMAVVQEIRRTVAAVVFDSAPCYPHAGSAGRALSLAVGLPRGGMGEATVRLAYELVGSALGSDGRVDEDEKSGAAFWRRMLSADFGCPELYAYSESDELLDVARLDALVDARRADGRSVHVLRVARARHVAVLRDAPLRYARALADLHERGVNAWRRRAGFPPWPLALPSSPSPPPCDAGQRARSKL